MKCGDKAYFGWYRVVLGGAESYDNCSVTLAGKESSFSANVCYRLDGTEKYDLNCEAVHTGKRTQSAISASGVLADKASKLMRGTIDFRTGCSGSVGNETEDVLLLSEEVRNQSVPVILCGSVGNETEDVLLLSEEVRNQSVPVILCSEEDVAGNHGASIGRPDEDMLFYMETRGVDEETACEMLARAKIDSVIRKIPDELVQEKIRDKIQGKTRPKKLEGE